MLSIPTVTIVICTRDRAHSLRETLASINRTSIPDGLSAEILIVNNHSRDHTQMVIEEAAQSGLRLRSYPEPRPGKCFAYNTALHHAEGQVLLFTDDDVRVPEDWIIGMCQPILDGKADAVAGGVVFPQAHEQMLASLGLNLQPYRSWFACTGSLDEVRPSRMVGANMAIHRRVVDRGLRFDEELGPGALGFGDETLFSLQLLAAGFTLHSAFDTAVEHCFDIGRLSPTAVRHIAHRLGKTRAFLFHHWHLHSSRLAPLYGLYFWMRRLASMGQSNSDLRTCLDMEEKVGFFREYLRQWRRPRKYQHFARDFLLH